MEEKRKEKNCKKRYIDKKMKNIEEQKKIDKQTESKNSEKNNIDNDRAKTTWKGKEREIN